jgi:cytochrome c oxidase subunit 1/cytochrome c oxidase subunit I+III
VIPVIASRHPLWEDQLDEGTERSMLDEGYLLVDGRQTMGTTPLDALPDVILTMPEDSYAPFFLGLFAALMFAALLLHVWWGVGLMVTACGAALIAWMWPTTRQMDVNRGKGMMHG